jgi:hypothetical protein
MIYYKTEECNMQNVCLIVSSFLQVKNKPCLP